MATSTATMRILISMVTGQTLAGGGSINEACASVTACSRRAPGQCSLTAVLLAAFVSLGDWQIGRAQEKQALIDSFERGTQTSVELAGGVAVDGLPRYQHVRGRRAGTTRRARSCSTTCLAATGRPGYRVLTPFVRDGTRRLLLVDRGWVPLGESRDVLPAVDVVSRSTARCSGRLDQLPVPGVRVGAAARARRHELAARAEFPAPRPDLEQALGAPRRVAHPAARCRRARRLRARLAARARLRPGASPRLRDPVVRARASGCSSPSSPSACSASTGTPPHPGTRLMNATPRATPPRRRGRRQLRAARRAVLRAAGCRLLALLRPSRWRPAGGTNKGDLIDPAGRCRRSRCAQPDGTPTGAGLPAGQVDDAVPGRRRLRRALPQGAVPYRASRASRSTRTWTACSACSSRPATAATRRSSPPNIRTSRSRARRRSGLAAALLAQFPALRRRAAGDAGRHLCHRPARQPRAELFCARRPTRRCSPT